MSNRQWTMECEAGSYSEPSLWSLLKEIITHRFWHWRRGDGWVD